MRTLVLNAGYEPLSVVTSRRAAVLVMRGKASILAEDGSPIASPSALIPRPAVILLHKYVRVVRRRPTAPSRRGILRRDQRNCGYCGKTAATVDHVIPKARGGDSSWENLVACCGPCNVRKGDKTLEQLGWELLVTPKAPPHHMWLPAELDAPREVWMPFLDHTGNGVVRTATAAA
ncbi:HNH endonuclease [Nesterenkonia sp. MY13]|uniref:HNH endonuclease n=1 Tax=Nesterenkonia sedimenti TaxID=1463632 RepID=A0A7X8TK16_9MICC|nr:HNH endonuclease [Nesterenkonia sedimenti]NLS09945.1 HNH endonuclease [Nesterenkonia sedimenti]